MPLSSLASLNVGKEEWGWAEGKKGLTPAINCSPREEPIHVHGQNRHRVVARRHLGRSGDYPTLLQSKTSVQAPRNRGQDAGCMGGGGGNKQSARREEGTKLSLPGCPAQGLSMLLRGLSCEKSQDT